MGKFWKWLKNSPFGLLCVNFASKKRKWEKKQIQAILDNAEEVLVGRYYFQLHIRGSSGGETNHAFVG